MLNSTLSIYKNTVQCDWGWRVIGKKYNQESYIATGWLLLFKIASLIKISFMVGSKAIFFSGSSVVGPLLGACTNIWMCSAAFILRMGISFWLRGAFTGALSALHIPGWLAALSWARPSFATKVFVPLACMLLFMAHPTGGQVWFYALYWLIPMGLYLCNCRSIFAQSLSATFIAHAVGSVIHVYTISMAPGNWLLLMPIVPVERLLFASAMTVLYYGIVWVRDTTIIKIARVMHSNVVSHNA